MPVAKKTMKQQMQAMADATSNAQRVKSTKLTQNEAKWNEPNVPSV